MKKIIINRILVALDPSVANRSTLQAGITLATNFNAELNVLFIEDVNLLRLAELPFVREIVYGSVTGRAMNVAGMERSIQTQSARLRKLVDTIAQQNRVKIAFECLRGDVASTICTASKQTDLLVIGKNTQLLRQSLKVGSITQAILSSSRCNIMVLQHGADIVRPVVVSFDGSEASLAALLLATRLAQKDHNQLIVLLPAIDDQDYHQLTAQIKENLDDETLQVQLVRLTTHSAEEILKVIEQFHGRILLLESGSNFLSDAQKRELVTQADIPIILLR